MNSSHYLPLPRQIDLGSGFHLNVLSERIATITDSKGNRKTTYFGFHTEEEALRFKIAIEQQGLGSAAIVRPSQRLSRSKWECKVWGCATQLIITLIERQSTVALNSTVLSQR